MPRTTLPPCERPAQGELKNTKEKKEEEKGEREGEGEEDRLKISPGNDIGANVPIQKSTLRDSSGPREHKGLSCWRLIFSQGNNKQTNKT